MHRLDHAAKPLSTDNVFNSNGFPFGRRILIRGRSMVSVGVRARFIVMVGELTNQIFEVVIAKRNEMIEAFGLDHLNKTFHPCVQIG